MELLGTSSKWQINHKKKKKSKFSGLGGLKRLNSTQLGYSVHLNPASPTPFILHITITSHDLHS